MTRGGLNLGQRQRGVQKPDIPGGNVEAGTGAGMYGDQYSSYGKLAAVPGDWGSTA